MSNKDYLCYEDCLHGGQRFVGGKYYTFQSEDQLPKSKPDKNGKVVIRHFEEIMSKTDEKRGAKIMNSKGIKRINQEIKKLKAYKNPTPMILSEIASLEHKITEITGDSPLSLKDVKATILPTL